MRYYDTKPFTTRRRKWTLAEMWAYRPTFSHRTPRPHVRTLNTFIPLARSA